MVLASSREERLKEIETGRVTREIIAYVTYLLLLILVSGHNLDSRSFLWTSSIRKILNTGPTVSQVLFNTSFYPFVLNIHFIIIRRAF